MLSVQTTVNGDSYLYVGNVKLNHPWIGFLKCKDKLLNYHSFDESPRAHTINLLQALIDYLP
jgi:hypothetical protein